MALVKLTCGLAGKGHRSAFLGIHQGDNQNQVIANGFAVHRQRVGQFISVAKNRIGFPPSARYPLRMIISRSLLSAAVAAALSTGLTSEANTHQGGGVAPLRVPMSEQTLSIGVPAPEGIAITPGSRWQLVESGPDGARIPSTLAPAPDKSGAAGKGCHILANVPPRAGAKGERQLKLTPEPDASSAWK